MSSFPINISAFKDGKKDPIFIHYSYIITVYFNDNTCITFEETTNNKYINLFTFNNNINFNNIILYELSVMILSFKNYVFNIKQNFIANEDIHIYKDNSLYIEITKNKDNYANCCVHINDTSRLYFTPPSY